MSVKRVRYRLVEQKVEAGQIDPDHLATLLNKKFRHKTFEVEVIHDIYRMKVPRKLSKAEIKKCRYDSLRKKEDDERRHSKINRLSRKARQLRQRLLGLVTEYDSGFRSAKPHGNRNAA